MQSEEQFFSSNPDLSTFVLLSYANNHTQCFFLHLEQKQDKNISGLYLKTNQDVSDLHLKRA